MKIERDDEKIEGRDEEIASRELTLIGGPNNNVYGCMYEHAGLDMH